MNKEEKENEQNGKAFDPATLVGKNVKELAKIYGDSESTFRRNIAAVKKELDEIKKQIRPGCKQGPRGHCYAAILVIVRHLGIPKKK